MLVFQQGAVENLIIRKKNDVNQQQVESKLRKLKFSETNVGFSTPRGEQAMDIGSGEDKNNSAQIPRTHYHSSNCAVAKVF